MLVTPSADEEFAALAQRYHEAQMKRHPTWATALGVHAHDGVLEDFTLAGQADAVQAWREFRFAFEAFDPCDLSPVHAHDREWLLAHISGAIETATVVRPLERNPDAYASALTESAFSLVNRQFAPPEERLEALLGRMSAMPGVLREAEVNLAQPPRVYTEITLAQLPGNRAFFETTVSEAFAGLLSEAQTRRLEAACQDVVAAFERFEGFLRETLLPRSNGSFALGADAFARKLYHDELVEIPLARLKAVGEADLRRNQAELRQLAETLQPGTPPAQTLVLLGRDHVPAASLLDTTQAMLEEIRGFIAARDLLSLPADKPLRVVETPPFMRATVAAAMDTPGPFEGVSTEAFYYMTLPNPTWPLAEQEAYMAQWTEAGLSNLSVHEAYPGHYVQFLLMGAFPSLTRRVLWAPSNAEGWAHYCEAMMLEQGFRDDLPRYRIAMLQDALLRNARLIVGLGLHTEGMTLDEAQAFFEREAFLARPVAQAEAWRGTLDPTYGYYTLGKLMLAKLREDYAALQGARFSLRAFHDAFLAQGPLPIPLIREALLGTRDGLL
ncbi:MAG: DUF885 domain-containing protein [Candidatus Sericytochromatia bacterium]|nr:DUF885 domain-containing protein [Candidatus Sericytochromatia bacterium]